MSSAKRRSKININLFVEEANPTVDQSIDYLHLHVKTQELSRNICICSRRCRCRLRLLEPYYATFQLSETADQ